MKSLERLVRRWARGLYRAALWSCPVNFRRGCAEAMQRDFDALCRECRGRAGRLAALALGESLNVISAGFGERVRLWRAAGRAASSAGRIESMNHEIRFACRSLRRNAGLSLAVLLSMGLGIGISSAVFSVVDHVLLRPLPFPQPDRLVRIWGADRSGGQRYQELSFQDFEALQQQARSFQSVAAFSTAPRRLTEPGEHPETVTLARISDGFFTLLKARFELGRGFTHQEYLRRERLAVLSHGLWQSRYGGLRTVLGSQIDLQGEAHRIIGVLPSDWEYPANAGLFRPLGDSAMQDDDREFFMLGRLSPGVSPQQASAQAASIIEGRADADRRTRGRYSAWVQPLQAMLVRDVQMPLLILMAAVGAVLLIVCLNVANLLLARGVTRRPEMALRSALGAGRGRLFRLVLWESLLLALGGGLLGIGLGYAVLEGLIAAAPSAIPRLAMISLDGRVIAVMASAVLACGLLAGLIPAWRDSRPGLHSAMAGARSSLGRRSGIRLRKGLVLSEVALATVLVIVAGLLASSFQRMIEFERGFSRHSLLEIRVGPSEDTTHSSSAAVRSLYEGIRTRLESLPGVQSVALSSLSPMRPGGLRVPVEIEGWQVAPQNSRVQMRFVSHDFFSAAGIPLLEGRSFDPGLDPASGSPSVIVNQAFVQAHQLEDGVTGRRILLPSFQRGRGMQPHRIVAVAADLRPQVNSDPRPAVYVYFQQRTWAYMHLLVQLWGDSLEAVPMIRQQIWSVAPKVTLDSVRTLDQIVSETLAGPRFSAALVGSFAALALILSTLGLYGVVSYSVSRQTPELALRRALGARGRGIAWLVLRQGLSMVLAGAALGIPAAFWAARLLSSQLYQVGPAAPSVYLPAVLLLSGACTLACLLPARRAIHLDPAAVLREE